MSITTHAKYTVVLNELLKNPETKIQIDEVLSKYPIYSPTSVNEFIPRIVPTREELNRKILNYYKYREIGFETVGRFLDELETTMCEIMPYYNQLMFTADQDYNIIYNVDYVRTTDTNRDGETSNTGESTAKTVTKTDTEDNSEINSDVNSRGKKVSSETPSNGLEITADNIDSVEYADNVSWNQDRNTDKSTTKGSSNSSADSDSTSTGTSTGTSKDVEKTVETIKGNFGVVSAQDLISKYRDIIINIEQMIINDARLTELFMLVY